MTKEQQIEQLKLAAAILKTGHPWEWRHAAGEWIKAIDSDKVALFASNESCQIRPILATPPDGRSLHNPSNLTAEQVGVGYRLLLPAEVDCRYTGDADIWSSGWCYGASGGSPDKTYRVPLSTPWPEAEKPKQKVPLEACDVPPGSVFRPIIHHDEKEWQAVSAVNGEYCVIDGYPRYFTSLSCWQINRSIPCTGKWNPDAWEPCEKEA